VATCLWFQLPERLNASPYEAYAVNSDKHIELINLELFKALITLDILAHNIAMKR